MRHPHLSVRQPSPVEWIWITSLLVAALSTPLLTWRLDLTLDSSHRDHSRDQSRDQSSTLIVGERTSKYSVKHKGAPHLWPTESLSRWLTEEGVREDDRLRGAHVTLSDQPLIAVIGDTRAALNNIGPSAQWSALATQISRAQPSVVLHLGDWVKRGSARGEWSAVLRSLRQLDGLPILSIRGNHDRGGLYEQLGFTDHPSAPLTITQVGPLLIITLDSEVSAERAQRVVERLVQFKREDPQRWSRGLISRGVSFILWAQHRPLWSGGNHGNDERGWRSWLQPALESLEVDLFLAGHDHHYERFCESIGSLGARRCVEDDERGVVYITSGGGASVTIPFPDLAWRATSAEVEENRLLRREVSDDPHYLTISCHHLEGKLRDRQKTQHTNQHQVSRATFTCDALLVRVWSVPYHNRQSMIDQLLIPRSR